MLRGHSDVVNSVSGSVDHPVSASADGRWGHGADMTLLSVLSPLYQRACVEKEWQLLQVCRLCRLSRVRCVEYGAA